MVARKPRVVIVGAGMAGISAAFQLQQVQTSSFDLTILEASQRIGGRIWTSQFGGDRIELGATWIHGVEGSPVYGIAEKIGALKGDIPWERQDGFPGEPIVRAEGGLTVDSAIVRPVMDLYKKMMSEIRAKGKLYHAEWMQKPKSIGTFLRQGFSTFLSQQAEIEQLMKYVSSDEWIQQLSGENSFGWSLRSLQDGVFAMHEYMERIATAANSLSDLDLQSEQEYREYPGEQITIGKGYMSVLDELASCLPPGTIQFGKKVQKFVWNRPPRCGAPVLIQCEDGSVIEADHVIITLSLGVLKAATSPANGMKDLPWADPEGKPVCRSIYDLQVRLPAEEVNRSLFEPPLPPCKLEAISRLGYGVVDKLFLQLDPSAEAQLRSHIQLMYKNEGFSKEGSPAWWMRKTFSVAPIYNGSNVLLCWFAGEEALEMEGLSDEEIISEIARTLAKFGVAQTTTKRSKQECHDQSLESSSSSDSEESSDDGETREESIYEKFRGMFSGVMRSQWGRNPLFQGSYSFVATGSSGKDFETLAEPLPKISCGEDDESPLQLLFAGEATDRHFYSTTHGAHRSGLREANRLLRHYGLSHVRPV